jgi:acetyl/propionyl-CoA carboxylase alpha subunit
VEWQLRVASGEPLPLKQEELGINGHAIEARLYAEDPAHGFMPSVGHVHRFFVGAAAGVRYDSGVASGSEISADFDGLLAKAVAHAPSRAEARARLVRSLREAHLHGVRTNRDALVALLESSPFQQAETTTDFVEQHPELLAPRVPDDVAAAHAAAAALVLRHRRHAAARVLRFVPPGWRNMPVAKQDASARVIGVGDTWIDLETDGIQARYWVHSAGDVHYVNGRGYQTEIAMAPRFAVVDAAAAAGGPTAPLPGKVVSVLVQAGERVQAGQTLVVLDAMKIEHRIAAEADGEVVEVCVRPGDRVDAHQVLVVLSA